MQNNIVNKEKYLSINFKIGSPKIDTKTANPKNLSPLLTTEAVMKLIKASSIAPVVIVITL